MIFDFWFFLPRIARSCTNLFEWRAFNKTVTLSSVEGGQASHLFSIFYFCRRLLRRTVVLLAMTPTPCHCQRAVASVAISFVFPEPQETASPDCKTARLAMTDTYQAMRFFASLRMTDHYHLGMSPFDRLRVTCPMAILNGAQRSEESICPPYPATLWISSLRFNEILHFAQNDRSLLLGYVTLRQPQDDIVGRSFWRERQRSKTPHTTGNRCALISPSPLFPISWFLIFEFRSSIFDFRGMPPFDELRMTCLAVLLNRAPAEWRISIIFGTAMTATREMLECWNFQIF